MWTNENRALYDRSKLRYPSDLTDAEWALIKPLIPPGKPGGNKQSVDMRKVSVGGAPPCILAVTPVWCRAF
jgi:transposase